MRSSPDVNPVCWGSFSLILLNLTIPVQGVWGGDRHTLMGPAIFKFQISIFWKFADGGVSSLVRRARGGSEKHGCGGVWCVAVVRHHTRNDELVPCAWRLAGV